MEVYIPKDIKKFKDKAYFNMTLRQLISLVVAVIIAVPLFILLVKKKVDQSVVSWIVVFSVVPVLAFGFFEYNDMTFERYLLQILKEIIYPPKRKYKGGGLGYEINVFEREERRKKKNEKKRTNRKAT